MYFLKVICSIVLFAMLIDGFTKAAEVKSINQIIEETKKVKTELDELYKISQKKCNFSVGNDQNYEKLLSEFLNLNVTSTPQDQRNKTKSYTTTKKPDSFITKMKRKFLSLVHRNHTDARSKRCFTDDGNCETTTGNEKETRSSSDVKEFEKFLLCLVECLSSGLNNTQDGGNVTTETTTVAPGNFNL